MSCLPANRTSKFNRSYADRPNINVCVNSIFLEPCVEWLTHLNVVNQLFECRETTRNTNKLRSGNGKDLCTRITYCASMNSCGGNQCGVKLEMTHQERIAVEKRFQQHLKYAIILQCYVFKCLGNLNARKNLTEPYDNAVKVETTFLNGSMTY